MDKLVVIGGDAAGMSAASQALRGRESLDVVVFEKGRYTSYAACGLPYFVGGLTPDAKQLIARSPEQHRANGIDVRVEHEVIAIDTAGSTVRVRDLATGAEFDESYGDLVIATGASPVRPPLPGIDTAGVFGVHTVPDALAIDALIRDRAPRHAVVVGAGYIGLEMAEAFMLRGLGVTVVERLEHPMTTLDPDMGMLVAEAMRGLGIDLHLGSSVESFTSGPDGWVRSVTTSGADGQREIPADVVVLGLGVRPNSRLATEAGIAVGTTGGIVTDARMATSVERVWAAGDCVENFHRVSRRPATIALGTHANKQGRVVGINVSGGHARFPGFIGTAVTKVAEVEIGRTGLTEHEARTAGFDAVSATIEADSRAHYYPDAMPMKVKVVAERGSGRMLGAQIVGGAEAAKRIDALAVAVWNEMTVDEFSQLDLGYAPPFSPVWDPTLIAARKAGGRVR